MEIGVLTFEHVPYNDNRKIIHIDMDAFYASVEVRDNPNLRGKPVIMAHHPKETNGRGIVSTCNYEARQFGVHSAMSAKKAFELCPQGVFIVPRFSHYKEISQQIRAIFRRYTDLIEPMSLDEAYLDVTHNKLNIKSAIYIAKCIQKDILTELQLTCSAGVSYNKFLAKIASDYQKPAGLTTILPEEAPTFLKNLPIEKFYGVGKKSISRLHEKGIFKGKDILKVDPTSLLNEYGKLGFLLLQRVRGIDFSPVKPNRERKSVGKENTFYPELANEDAVKIVIRQLSQSVATTLQRMQVKGSTVTLKIRYTDFETITRQHSLEKVIDNESDIYYHALDLWEDYGHLEKNIRLIGVSVSHLSQSKIEKVSLEL